MSDATLYYRHSSGFKPAALMITLIAGFATGVMGGALYGIITFYMPVIYINGLLTIGMGLGLGSVVGEVARWQKIRSVLVVALIALLSGLCAEYAACVGWISAVASFKVLILDPTHLMHILGAVAEKGIWSISGMTPSGPSLVTIWIVEALIIIGGSVVAAYYATARLPFCEACACWLNASTLVGPFQPVHDPAQFKAKLERGDFAELGNLAPVQPHETCTEFAECDVIDCPNCDETAMLTVRNMRLIADKGGTLNWKAETILDRLLIDKASCDLIKELGPKAQQTPSSTEGEPGEEPSEASGEESDE